MGAHLPAIIVSVDYRLAPEHRLPAAYDDAVEALHWIKIAHEQWLTEFADMSSCFLMGTSAGGNIAYHAGLRVASKVVELEPLKIQGLILHHAFFGGLGRTGSELRLSNDPIVTLSGSDHMWELSLPIGADRDHEYSNPMVNNGSDQLQSVRLAGWRILVTGCHDDLLIDRQIELANMLEEKGLRAVAHFGEGYHSIELLEESKAKELFGVLKNFISTSCADFH
ncbi:carboxyesterase 20 [Actinidia rufa]|uniref:Carboxyesterase 20 n=1 Tax=Actinidia rufa TaxID=165716 RepID=A0A7J0E7M6_9ERIC|nr:carboxyesterase 20 [Actinidia rufa]